MLPVALIPDSMSKAEVKRRCDIFQLLLDHRYKKRPDELTGAALPKCLFGRSGKIICVNRYGEANGIQQLKNILSDAAIGTSLSFGQAGTLPPDLIYSVHDAIKRLKHQEHKFVSLDQVRGELQEEVTDAGLCASLHFIAGLGEVIYFGEIYPKLCSWVVLDPCWLAAALSSVLRSRLQRDFTKNMSKIRKGCSFPNECADLIATLNSCDGSNCPLLSGSDLKMVFIR